MTYQKLSKRQKLVNRIVKAIWDDLDNRDGFDLSCRDICTQMDIKQTWSRKIESLLAAAKDNKK